MPGEGRPGRLGLPSGGADSLDRRQLLAGLAGAGALSLLPGHSLAAAGEVRFGLTPVFLTSDLELLTQLKTYLSGALGRPVTLVTRRTYQEITALLLSGQLDAAWICGYPFIQYRDRLSLVAVPLWRGRPLYQSYLIVGRERPAEGIEDLRGDLHAFSDPDSNSGHLVTQAALAALGEIPDRFFSKTFFTYSHRNVVRAVASGLAQSGSVDGYVWEVMSELEPGLTGRTKVVRKSEWLGFPPIACAKTAERSDLVADIRRALVAMGDDQGGRRVLNLLRLDGFTPGDAGLFDGIARNYDLVRSLG
jgi:phosphonate transport system substrate-binding protein